MSKPLEELVAAQAGVSQAVLDRAYNDLTSLEAEMAAAEAEAEKAIAKKKDAQASYDKVKDSTREVLHKRDAIFEEWQRAAWIVRNADPDHPAPPTGIRPPDIKTPREG